MDCFFRVVADMYASHKIPRTYPAPLKNIVNALEYDVKYFIVNDKTNLEYEADEFIVELLVPWEKFGNVWKTTEDISTTQGF